MEKYTINERLKLGETLDLGQYTLAQRDSIINPSGLIRVVDSSYESIQYWNQLRGAWVDMIPVDSVIVETNAADSTEVANFIRKFVGSKTKSHIKINLTGASYGLHFLDELATATLEDIQSITFSSTGVVTFTGPNTDADYTVLPALKFEKFNGLIDFDGWLNLNGLQMWAMKDSYMKGITNGGAFVFMESNVQMVLENSHIEIELGSDAFPFFETDAGDVTIYPGLSTIGPEVLSGGYHMFAPATHNVSTQDFASVSNHDITRKLMTAEDLYNNLSIKNQEIYWAEVKFNSDIVDALDHAYSLGFDRIKLVHTGALLTWDSSVVNKVHSLSNQIKQIHIEVTNVGFYLPELITPNTDYIFSNTRLEIKNNLTFKNILQFNNCSIVSYSGVTLTDNGGAFISFYGCSNNITPGHITCAGALVEYTDSIYDRNFITGASSTMVRGKCVIRTSSSEESNSKYMNVPSIHLVEEKIAAVTGDKKNAVNITVQGDFIYDCVGGNIVTFTVTGNAVLKLQNIDLYDNYKFVIILASGASLQFEEYVKYVSSTGATDMILGEVVSGKFITTNVLTNV